MINYANGAALVADKGFKVLWNELDVSSFNSSRNAIVA
jgi:hypothetical protein